MTTHDRVDDVIALPDREYDVYTFDLDGTIYLGDGLLPGARETVETLRDRGKVVRFLSNNPTKDPEQYAEKLDRPRAPDTARGDRQHDGHDDALAARARARRGRVPDRRGAAQARLREAGITMSEDPAEIDIVVASYDRTFEYRKLQIAFDAIWFHRRARLIATNPDRFCPFPGGRGEPDCAAIIAAIEACTGATCEANLGKPNPAMLHTALEGIDVDLADCVMVGDRLQTDIRMGVEAGMAAALVLTGETTADDVRGLAAAERPPIVLDRIDRLLAVAGRPD